MHIGTQYYRAPFPRPQYWDDDLARMKASGLSCVQFWVLWGWVEPSPGDWRFDDYDRLVELAGKHGLQVILSTVGEIQPLWIHREVPGSEMIDSMGRTVVSSFRGECHFGLTPGGCTDHPGVWERMAGFLSTVTRRYRSAEHLLGWDAWNETRWNVQADGLVCYCAHTLREFRAWLDAKYGGLDGLNDAWLRRYTCWEDVMPGKTWHRPYTEMMAFQHFLTWRADQHAKARYDVIKPLDPERPVTVHGPVPCVVIGGTREDHALNRGNDWNMADALDGVGCSSFPKWFHFDDADYGMRVEFVKSAAQGKRVWLSEVQGGRSSIGFTLDEPVDALTQQRWVWNGLACGAETLVFWCWRDETWGRESAGFGLSGLDGRADERLAAMAHTGDRLRRHHELWAAYQPAQAEVGVLFSPQTYYLSWAEEGKAERMVNAVQGYCRALVGRSIPYIVVEQDHLRHLDGLKVLFMPHNLVLDDAAADRLAQWVRDGGTLVCESECGAFNSQGIYRYPEDRFLAKLTGVREIGRRSLQTPIRAEVDGRTLSLDATTWLTPYAVAPAPRLAEERGGSLPSVSEERGGTAVQEMPAVRVLAEHDDGPLALSVPVGAGTVVFLGSYLGEGYWARKTADFETLLESIVRGAGWMPAVECLAPAATPDCFVYLKHGTSGGRNIAFVFFPPEVETASLRFAPGFFPGGTARDIIADQPVALADGPDGQTVELAAPAWRFAVLVGD